MTYETWRISYQSSEQAARAAYEQVEELSKKLAAYESSGYALVPVEPTIKMLNAGWNELGIQNIDPEAVEMQPVYAAMLEAAPAPSRKEVEPLGENEPSLCHSCRTDNQMLACTCEFKTDRNSDASCFAAPSQQKREPLSDVADWAADTWPMDKRYTLEEIVERIRAHGIT